MIHTPESHDSYTMDVRTQEFRIPEEMFDILVITPSIINLFRKIYNFLLIQNFGVWTSGMQVKPCFIHWTT